ncbi:MULTISPECIES: hypothetical protein [Streptomyces]|uniref:Uncharacterized protein n=1 Tax=Streptomyces evansiae TaxID=3075535 RepID=A0ABU2QVC8_9ACTN|nr:MULTISPECIES: hypothetical protein [unclassified Streptomyces]MDT0407779.1 hypothetical protein [Streptomyces sp. DSM 41979]MYQ60899.1 hypothetical protein [Streptomyces sp. SID4926]SCE23702.1 hypothetical protein GA0115252_136811 [Streptomyces sp. DfronAA-171]
MPDDYTVDDLIAALQQVPGYLRVRLAIQPDFPFAHTLHPSIVVSEGIAYIAEAGQDGYLPPAATRALAWG